LAVSFSSFVQFIWIQPKFGLRNIAKCFHPWAQPGNPSGSNQKSSVLLHMV
jgi:hypothetical protein